MTTKAPPPKRDRPPGGSGTSGGGGTTPFFGRRAELEQFEAELRDPRGSAILVVGQQAMGKSVLLKEFIEQAQHYPSLKCRAAWFSVTQGDSAELTMSLIMSDAEGEAEERAGFLEVTDRGRRQLKAIFELLPKGESITKLAATLKHNRKLHIREQLRSMFQLLSARLPADARAIFVIEPRKYLGKESGEEWAIVLEDLPDRIKFIIEQRPEDDVATCDSFLALRNLVRIPKASLDVWLQDEIDACLDEFTPPSGIMMSDVRSAIASYNGHPFAIMKALELIEDDEPLDDLPKHPMPREFAQRQWERVSKTHGPDAISLMQSYSILEEPVPDDLAIEVAALDGVIFETLLARPFLAGLLPIQPQTTDRRLYHTVFAEFIQERSDTTGATNGVHNRAIKAYRTRLKRMPPDDLAARRLALHVRAVDSDDAFVMCFVNECTPKLRQLGLLDEIDARTAQALATVNPDSEVQAALFGNLGIAMHIRGDLDAAEEMHRKALEISQKLGSSAGKAHAYGNLGIVMQMRSDLDGAEAMHCKSLAIEQELGNLEGMASAYASLGNIMQTRGELDGAEAIYGRALKIQHELGHLEGIAVSYGNLGNIMQTRGDLEGAEAMYHKAFQIDEKLGNLEGVASAYGNLGNIMRTRGNLEAAEAMYYKSLELEKRISRLPGMANAYGSLGLIMQARDDLDGAEVMHRKSLEIEKKLGHLEGMAQSYGHLGNVMQIRGDRNGAEAMYRKALEIDEKLSCLEGVASNYANLGLIMKTRGDLSGARTMWTKARDLFSQLGAQHMVDKVQRWIDELTK